MHSHSSCSSLSKSRVLTGSIIIGELPPHHWGTQPVLRINSKDFALFQHTLDFPGKQLRVNQEKVISCLGQKLAPGAFTMSENPVTSSPLLVVLESQTTWLVPLLLS